MMEKTEEDKKKLEDTKERKRLDAEKKDEMKTMEQKLEGDDDFEGG